MPGTIDPLFDHIDKTRVPTGNVNLKHLWSENPNNTIDRLQEHPNFDGGNTIGNTDIVYLNNTNKNKLSTTVFVHNKPNPNPNGHTF